MLDTQFACHAAPRAWLAGFFIAPLLALSSGCSLLLDFDAKGDVQDSGPTADAFFASRCQAFEPNNAIDAAADGDLPGSMVEASICPGTGADFYTYTAPGSQSVTISAQYVGTGEVGLRIHDPDMPMQQTEIKNTVGSAGLARLQLAGNELMAKGYVIEVYSNISGGEVDYTLSVADGTQ